MFCKKKYKNEHVQSHNFKVCVVVRRSSSSPTQPLKLWLPPSYLFIHILILHIYIYIYILFVIYLINMYTYIYIYIFSYINIYIRQGAESVASVGSKVANFSLGLPSQWDTWPVRLPAAVIADPEAMACECPLRFALRLASASLASNLSTSCCGSGGTPSATIESQLFVLRMSDKWAMHRVRVL